MKKADMVAKATIVLLSAYPIVMHDILGFDKNDMMATWGCLMFFFFCGFTIYSIRDLDNDFTKKFNSPLKPWWWHFSILRVGYAKFLYWQFNKKAFKGQLPMIPLAVEYTKNQEVQGEWVKTIKGSCVIGKHDDSEPWSPPVIRYSPKRITIFGWFSMKDFKETLAHEMVHAMLAWGQINEPDHHGEIFERMMEAAKKKLDIN